jgi:multidrug resistance efflux pump
MSVTNAQNDITKAKQDLIQTRANYESRILTSQANIESQKNTIKLNTATYNDTINGNNTDVVSARNSIKSAQISLEKTILALKDYQIYANYDGVISDIPWQVGSQTLATESISVTNTG